MSFEKHAAYAALLPRLPSNLTKGKNDVLVATMTAGAALMAKAAEVAKDDGRSAKGRAQVLDHYLKSEAVPALVKSRRQHQYHEGRLQGKRDALRKAVIGEHDPLDRERRDVIRAMTPNERIAAVLSDPELRGAALRGGSTLAGVPQTELDRAFSIATEEMVPAKVAEIKNLEAAQDFHAAVLRVFANDLQKIPAVIEPNGAVREMSPWEVEKVIESIPAPAPHIKMREEIEADRVDDAA